MNTITQSYSDQLAVVVAAERNIDESVRQGCAGMIRLWGELMANPNGENVGRAIASSLLASAAFEGARAAYALAETVRGEMEARSAKALRPVSNLTQAIQRQLDKP